MRALALVGALAACGGGAERPPPGPPAIVLRVTDGPRGPVVPARVTILAGGEPVRFGVRDYYDGLRQAAGACWLAPGALGTWDGVVLPWGEAEIPIDATCGAEPWLQPGRYEVWVWRGIEHERWTGAFTLEAGRREVLDVRLTRVFDPGDALAADLHVHAAASPDSTVPEVFRAMTLAAAGVRVVALSDHNWTGDLDDEIAMLGLGPQLASIASLELGSDWLHAGIYPARATSPSEDDTMAWSAADVMAWGRAQPGRPIIQINHPRYRVVALHDVAGWDGVSWPPPFPLDFDAIEVLSGTTVFQAPGDRRLDEGVRDFYTYIDHGVLVTAVGNSDTHHLDGIRDGLSRTYVLVDDPRTAPFDEAGFVDAIRARKAIATSGPWLEVEARAIIGAGDGAVTTGGRLRAPGGRVRLELTVAQASFSRADHLRVRFGTGTGHVVVQDIPVTPGTTWQRTIDVTLPADGWIGVDVGGDTPLPVELTGDQLVTEGRPGATPFAIINPILIDADGDGRVTYAATEAVIPR